MLSPDILDLMTHVSAIFALRFNAVTQSTAREPIIHAHGYASEALKMAKR